MSIRLYLIHIDNQTYNIVESINITEHLKLLQKYSPFLIENKKDDKDIKCYQQFNIRADWRQIQSIPTIERYTFIDLLDTKYSSYKIKPNWYQFDLEILGVIKQFIYTFLPPLSGTDITTDAKYKCTKCNKLYQDQRCFNRHVKLCSQDITYKCQTCSISYKSSTRYHNHILKCKPLQCEICQKTFSSKQMLDKHIEKGCGTFTCEACGKLFHSKYKIQHHCLQVHQFTYID